MSKPPHPNDVGKTWVETTTAQYNSRRLALKHPRCKKPVALNVNNARLLLNHIADVEAFVEEYEKEASE